MKNPMTFPTAKRVMSLLLVLVLLIGLVGCGKKETTPPPAVITPAPAATAPAAEAPAVEAPAATEAPAAPATEAPATEAPVVSGSKTSTATLAAFIEENAASNFSHYDLSYDDTSITLSIWEDGISMGAVLAASGNAEFVPLWEELVDTMVELSKAMTDYAEVYGRDDVMITLNVLNDQDTSKVLLMIVDGIVLYDSVRDD